MTTPQLRRWLRRSLAGVLGVSLLLTASLFTVLDSLDRPWLKRHVQAFARAAAGLEIDYRVLRVHLLSGVELSDFVVRSPEAVRPFAPELVRVGRLAVRWSLRALLSDRGPWLEAATLSEVVLAVVVDEHGRTSFDALPRAQPPAAAEPSVPLSRQPGELLAMRAPCGALQLERVTFELLRTQHGAVLDRSQLRGVSLALTTSSAAARGFELNAGLGTPAEPLELELSRAAVGGEPNAARLQLWAAANASASDLRAELELRMKEQSFVANVSADRWLHAQAKLHFDPSAGRTLITLERVEAGDGAATADATLEVPDTGAPSVRHAHAELDLARIMHWLPAGLIPVTAERAHVRAEVDSLTLGPVVRLASSTGATLDAELSNVAIQSAAAPLFVEDAKLSLRAEQPDAGGVSARGSLAVRAAHLPGRASAEDVACEFAGKQAADGVIDAHVGVRFGQIADGPVVARAGQIELDAQTLRPDLDDWRKTRGELSLSMALGSLAIHAGPSNTLVSELACHAHTAVTGRAPYAAELTAAAARVQIADSGGLIVADAPAHIAVEARAIEPDYAQPLQSRGVVHIALETPDVKAAVAATKEADALDYTLEALAHNLKSLRALLPLPYQSAWDRMTVKVKSTGRLEHLRAASPALEQHTELGVERFAYQAMRAQAFSLLLKSRGTLLRQRAELELHTRGFDWGDGAASDDHVTLTASLDRKQPALAFELAATGRTHAQLSAALSFDRARSAVVYEIAGQLAELSAFAHQLPVLDAFDLSRLELTLSARGALLGVVSAVGQDGTIALEREPTRSGLLEGTADLRLAHLHWGKGGIGIAAPELHWHGELRGVAARRTLDSQLDVPTLHVGVGTHVIDLNGVNHTAQATLIGDLAKPETELQQRLAIRAVEQTLLPAYPLGDLTVELSADHAPDGALHIAQLKAANGAAGTSLSVEGNLDLGDGRRSLSLNCALAQELERLSTIPERLKARGKLQVEANVNSPDLAHYRIRATVKGESVDLTLAHEGVELESANGEVPITVALEVGAHGVTIERTQQRNPYSMLRFADQLPLLRRSGFISIGRLKTPFASIAPLVGNLEIEQNLIALRQFEMGVRGGTITGQLGLDWDGPKSTLELHVRASGVQSSHGEPFDGNIALAISAADRTIDGRAEVLRIGERHLLDLLDLQDPLHVDPAMNRIRSALDFGYPESLRLVFDRGFASARLKLGGLASLVSISELRGIPMGPIVDRLIVQMSPASDLKEMP